MKRLFILFLLALALFQYSAAQRRIIQLKLIHTTDIHGSYFPFNFASRFETKGSLARVSTYVKNQRKNTRQSVLLFDNGDILQGQPTSYFYNYVDTTDIHLCAAMMNEMKYNVGNLGNHDVETSTKVFTRWTKECNFPIICANAISNKTGKPFFEPYKIFVRNGVKIAVIGMITSAIPCWLSENIYQGLHFDDMETTARYWINIIREKEQPDIIVGLFHSGIQAMTLGDKYRENASQEVAERVPGFDIIMCGHDHQQYCKWVKNIAGQNVLIINPGKDGYHVSDVNIKIVKGAKNRTLSKQIVGQVVSMKDVEPDKQLISDFSAQYDTLKNFVLHKLGTLDKDILGQQAFFGPCDFMGGIHSIQLNLTGADISFASPFSKDAKIGKGDFLVGDLFNLYKYENTLYVMKLSGLEIKKYLEASYNNWISQMHNPTDHLLLLDTKDGQTRFKNDLFNFDSAAGIYYTVDVTKPKGQRISILKMANGEPFLPTKIYRVVVNSYRGNGGGGLLLAAGISSDELKNRIIYRSEKEMRFYIMRYIEQHGTGVFNSLNQWKFIPEEWTVAAAQRDAALLFDEK